MKTVPMLCRALLAATSFFALIAGPVYAQANYPNKPVRIVVPFAPGGGSDFIARFVAARLTEKLKQTFIVDNRPGAGGNLGAEIALAAPADGYTILLTAASYTVNPAVYKLKFDPLAGVSPIAQLARGPMIVAINPKLPANNLKELVELAKKQPGKFSYASSGKGGMVHLATEFLLETVNIDILHIPYKGTGPALFDTIANQTQLVLGTPASTLPLVKATQLRALAVTTPRRLAALPDVPTVVESGYPVYQVTNWHGLVTPKGLPKGIQTALNTAVNEALRGEGIEKTLSQDGLTVAGGTPEEFHALLASEITRWGTLAKKRNLKAD